MVCWHATARVMTAPLMEGWRFVVVGYQTVDALFEHFAAFGVPVVVQKGRTSLCGVLKYDCWPLG